MAYLLNIKSKFLVIAIIALLVITINSPLVFGQRVGEMAPDFQFRLLTDCSESCVSNLEKYRGKIIILEFWATWCAPCRVALKQYNEIAKKLADKPIAFLAVSREEEEDVLKFLRSNPSTLIMALDSTGEAFRKYGVVAIPFTLVLGKDGKIIAITNAKEITEDRLKALLSGNSVEFEQMLTTKEILDRENAIAANQALPSVRFMEFPQTLDEAIGIGFIKIDDKGSTLTATTILPLLIREAYQIQPYQEKTMSPTSLVRERFYVNIRLPEGNVQALRDTLKNVIRNSLNLDMHITKEKQNIFVLKRKEGSPEPTLSTSLKAEFSYDRTKVKAIKQPIASLLKYLNTFKKVMDETGLKGEYDLTFSWDITKKYGLEEGLASLGLEIVRVEREIEMYAFTQKSPASN